MRRRRQCPSWTKREIGLQCQRRARHDGPHQASFFDRAPTHLQWEDGANQFGYEVRPGTVRYRPAETPSLAYRLGEWTASVLFRATFGVLMWVVCSPTAAVTYCLVVVLLLSVRQPRGLWLGRWLLWSAHIPRSQFFGLGRIAVTDTPRDPAPGQAKTRDGQGRVLILGGVAFAVLRCRSAPARREHP
ncbi:hypothetical protein [Streptomyces sp. SP18BB07]|uniref:hypothetical protein n=1 Tax=Streptomyces sp. SP18BB07 TaxID=3002522 RepID=UPI002E780598|nr:hypothetical protein [Streptomyces sp. SP18BB07]MEE1764352.1 hypothetical protein [Streptomyces sp. SP18BB07]